jgi:hypothetical protein
LKFVSKLSPDAWAEARRLRAAGRSYAAIARHFGLVAATVADRARRERWPSPADDPASAIARKAKARRPSPGTADIRAALALRLFSVIAVRIRMMELQMHKQLEACERSGTEPPSPTQDQREAFATLIENINQVTEMASEPAATADGRRKSANPDLTRLSTDIDPDGLAIASEKDDLRAELAERLGSLFPKS